MEITLRSRTERVGNRNVKIVEVLQSEYTELRLLRLTTLGLLAVVTLLFVCLSAIIHKCPTPG